MRERVLDAVKDQKYRPIGKQRGEVLRPPPRIVPSPGPVVAAVGIARERSVKFEIISGGRLFRRTEAHVDGIVKIVAAKENVAPRLQIDEFGQREHAAVV